SIIEGHLSALKELLKEPSNRDLIKPLLLNFNDQDEDVDDEVEEVFKRNKEKAVMTNPKDKGKVVAMDDLSKPFKEVLKCPFTKRIIEFSAPGHRLPTNAKVYDGTGDPKYHITRFTARAWFDKLPPGSIDNWGDLREKFLNRFRMLKACGKDPTEISKIIRKANETFPNFKERWVSESNAIPSVPKLMQISSFMSSHKCPELSKRFSDSIPKTVDEILKRVDDYVRSEEAFRDTELPRGEFQQREGASQWIQKNDLSTPKEILATKHQLHLPQPPPSVGTPSKENINRYCEYHNEKGHITNDCFHLMRQLEIALESGKLNHLVRDVRQKGKNGPKGNDPQKGKVINMVFFMAKDRKRKSITIDEDWMNVPIVFPPIRAKDLSDEAIVVEAESEGYPVYRIHVDEGASIEIMYEYCFNMLHPTIRSRLTETHTMVSGFSEEQVKPLDKIELDVCFGRDDLCRRAIMKFTVISDPSPYNIILGCPGLKQLRAIPSTIHGMMKFPTL
ncbi:reverse transcriptase domain-containing protein, partial [Tanacetum coccineum]